MKPSAKVPGCGKPPALSRQSQALPCRRPVLPLLLLVGLLLTVPRWGRGAEEAGGEEVEAAEAALDATGMNQEEGLEGQSGEGQEEVGDLEPGNGQVEPTASAAKEAPLPKDSGGVEEAEDAEGAEGARAGAGEPSAAEAPLNPERHKEDGSRTVLPAPSSLAQSPSLSSEAAPALVTPPAPGPAPSPAATPGRSGALVSQLFRDPLWELQPPTRDRAEGPAAEIVEIQPAAGTAAAPAVKGYKLTLSGELRQDLVLRPEQSPALVLGMLVIPKDRRLVLAPGTRLVLMPDTQALPSNQPGTPEPSQVGQLWVLGRLLADGLAGGRVGIEVAPRQKGALYFFGEGASELRGVEVKDVAITQQAGSVSWIGARFQGSPHYALAAGAAIFMHCAFERCGGILATYEPWPWSLFVRRCLFKECEDGLVFSNNPGERALQVEENAFSGTRGAHLRVWRGEGSAVAREPKWQEFLIGENYYGTAIPEEIDARIVDGRTQRSVRARINTRPPAERNYEGLGPEVTPETIARTYHRNAPVWKGCLEAYARARSQEAARNAGPAVASQTP